MLLDDCSGESAVQLLVSRWVSRVVRLEEHLNTMLEGRVLYLQSTSGVSQAAPSEPQPPVQQQPSQSTPLVSSIDR